MNLFRPIYSVLSPAGPRGRLSVFIFHRVLSAPDPLLPNEPDVRQFDQMLGWIRSGFNVLPLDEAVGRIKAGTLPARSASITFDDGYADNCTLAMPMLLKHGLSATFFIATGYLDGGRMWNDSVTEAVRKCAANKLDLGILGMECLPTASISQKLAARDKLLRQIKYLPPGTRLKVCAQLAEQVGGGLPDDLMLRSDQVIAMRHAGMVIGAHTQGHPILAKLEAPEVRREILESKLCLEGMLGERVGLFAYPNGGPGTDYRAGDVDVVRELGFDAAVSTAWGTAGCGSDLFQIPRFTPWDRTRGRFGARMVSNFLAPPNDLVTA